MKRQRLKHALGGLLISSVLTVLMGLLCQNLFNSRKTALFPTQSPAATNDYIPPPPVNPKQSGRKLALNPPSQQSSVARNRIYYDEKLSFVENLQRLKKFCRANRNDAELQQMLIPFLKVLFEQAPQQYQTVKGALEDLDGSPAYRNILLACLMANDGNLGDKANIVWRIALDSREPVEVRRTASFLTSQVDDGQQRPADLYAILSDADAQVVLFALENSTRHLDQRNYDLIRTNLINSRDIHLRVAAIKVIGSSVFADSQTALTSIMANAQTSKDSAFSEPSLLKRAAIPHLNMNNPEVFALVRRIALDDAEDPGVRAKAIGRFTPTEFPAETGMLLEMLGKLDANDTVPLRAVVDTLLTAPTPDRIQTIRAKADEMTDPQIRNLLRKRIEIATQDRKP
ncbi:MAG: hypothetical protein HOP33_17990 [Verrucomicrobia bacterium]|nr:hypothetical protein [Verrucomicrobiota bacterium]